jgi:hypothetical protein
VGWDKLGYNPLRTLRNGKAATKKKNITLSLSQPLFFFSSIILFCASCLDLKVLGLGAVVSPIVKRLHQPHSLSLPNPKNQLKKQKRKRKTCNGSDSLVVGY